MATFFFVLAFKIVHKPVRKIFPAKNSSGKELVLKRKNVIKNVIYNIFLTVCFCVIYNIFSFCRTFWNKIEAKEALIE